MVRFWRIGWVLLLLVSLWFPGATERHVAAYQTPGQAQELLNNDRPSLILAVQNDLQAWRTDRFEIPTDSCDLGGVLFNYWALSQIEPK